MNNYEWEDHYLTGVEHIDKAHKQLFSTVRRMSRFFEDDNAEKWKFACKEGLKFLKNYAVSHCAAEEVYMREIAYDRYAAHKRLHDNFRDQVLPTLEKELEESDYSQQSVQKFIGLCLGWLTGHIITEDLAIVGKHFSKLNSVSETRDILALEETISDIMEGMFGTPAKVINPAYVGEDFGEALYYEMVYDYITEDQRVKVLLGLEEKLLLQHFSMITDFRPSQITATVISTMQELAKMFMQLVGSRFVSLEDTEYSFQDGNLLTAGEFKRELEKKIPRYSILFHTEFGNFVFCVDILITI